MEEDVTNHAPRNSGLLDCSAIRSRHRFVAGFARIRAISREIGQRPNSCESGYHLARILANPATIWLKCYGPSCLFSVSSGPLWCYVPAGREGKLGRVVQEAALIREEQRGMVVDISIVIGGRSG